MLRNLSFSLTTLVLLLLKPFGALAIDPIHFIISDWTGIAAGTPFSVAWSGGNPAKPAQLALLNGPPENLKPVQILVESSHSPYIWIPDQSLVAGTYALSITQYDVTNYSPQFQVENAYDYGGSGVAGSAGDFGGAGVAVGAGAGAGPSASAPPSSTSTDIGTGPSTLPILYYPAVAPTASENSITYAAVGASASTITPPTSPSYPSPAYPYPYGYGSAGIGHRGGAGNGSTLGVATGIAHSSEYKVLGFTGGAAERGAWASLGMLAVGAGVGVVFGGGSGW